MANNATLFKKAQQFLAGGVNSPVRAFTAVGGTPLFIESGSGAYVQDCEGKRYIDYVGAWGPAILGHAHPAVRAALKEQLDKGIGFGAPCALETDLAQIICDSFETVEQVRFTNSGTEAVMSAVRLARGHTGRNGIVKFVGAYHGHSDSMLVDAGPDAAGHGQPGSAGVPAASANHTYCAQYNDASSVAAIMEAHGEDIACVIVEPVAGNMGCVLPVEGFLPDLQTLCKRHGALLIFDEVMTGYRITYGGAQAHYGVHPDLTVLGKIIGGGMPVGAVAGPRAIMSRLAPLGPVYQAGTLSGNPIAMCCGISTIAHLGTASFYTELSERTEQLASGLAERAHAAGVQLAVSHVGGMFGMFFGVDNPPNNYEELSACDSDVFRTFFHRMLDEGVYFAPSAYEAAFVSGAHGTEVIAQTLAASERVFSTLE